MRKPIAYLRKSRVTSDRHVSWEVQEAEIRALAARHGDTDLDLLSDWGRSGRGEKTRLRGEYARLRAMIAADEVSVVYAYSLSRLSRSVGEYASLAELCRDHGVRVRLAKEGEFDYASVSGRFTVGILALVAQMEAEQAQERARDTITARRARGDHVGSAGYGKRLVKGRLIDDPKHDLAAVVDAYREAGSFGGAAKALNRQSIPTKSGRAWEGTTVARILRREVPAETAVRRIEPRVRQRGSFALSRLLRCPCGTLMTGRTSTHTTKYGTYGPYVSYQCYRGRYDPKHQRPYMVSEADVLPWVQAEVARLQMPADAVEAEAGNDTERAALVARRGRVIDNYEDGLIDKAARDAKLTEIGDALEAIETVVRVTAIPEVDWSWPPSALNDVLRAILVDVTMGTDLRPVSATWTMPTWRDAA